VGGGGIDDQAAGAGRVIAARGRCPGGCHNGIGSGRPHRGEAAL